VNILHGVKGVSRAAGFRALKFKTHDAEDKILSAMEARQPLDQESMQRVRKDIDEEWRELIELYNMLHGARSDGKGPESFLKEGIDQKTQSLTMMVADLRELVAKGRSAEATEAIDTILLAIGRLPHIPLEAIEGRLKSRVKLTADQTTRKAEVHFKWRAISVPESHLSVITDVLSHLLTNAIDHGIEAHDARLAKKKDPVGQIMIAAVEDGDYIHVKCEDDGAGIDVEAIKRHALEAKIADNATLAKMTEAEAMGLIFRAGFSTRSKQVTEISGRGIGLDSVVQAIQSLKGTGIAVRRRQPEGTVFEFRIKRA